MNNKKSILITGFNPFGPYAINPTESLINWLSAQKINADCVFKVLPTEFENAGKKLEDLLTTKQFDLAIHFGLSEKAKKIMLEKVALNYIFNRLPDNSGKCYDGVAIRSDEPDAIMTALPVEAIIKNDDRFDLSLSAGSYVCNYIYFLSSLMLGKEKGRSLFVHVPATVEMQERFTYSQQQINSGCLDLINKLILRLE